MSAGDNQNSAVLGGSIKPIVRTFYNPVPGRERPQKLLNLWAETWQAGGFDTQILSEEDARSHPGYKYFNDRVSRFPTVNPREYERACFIRHLAMANIGGGLAVDYDVMLMNHIPEFEPVEGFGVFPPFPYILEPTRVPCAVMGTEEAFEQICDYLCEYQPAQQENHVSDMTILRKTRIQTGSSCVEHLCSGHPIQDDLGDGWKTAPLVHFSTFSFAKLGWKGDKADLILRVLKTL